MTTPLISVVIPVYNRARLLQIAIESVLSQTYTDYEVIVVDDGSTDDLKAAVPGLHHSRVLYVRQSNQGVAAARNVAISKARGRALLFLDSDDALLPRALEVLYGGLLASSGAAVAYGWATLADDTGYTTQRTRPKATGRPWRQYLYANPTPPATLLLRSDIFDAGHTFDSSLALFEDWDLWLRLAWHYEFICVREIVARITSQPVQRSSSRPARVVGEVMHTIYAKLNDEPLAAPIVRRYARQLQANVHVMMGHHYRLYDGDQLAARREFMTAVRLAPTFGRAYIGLAEALLGPVMIHHLRALRSRFFSLMVRRD